MSLDQTNKTVYKPRTRQDISNPFHKIPHDELLKLAGVEKFTDYRIEELRNGRIRVVPFNKKIETRLTF